MVTRRRPERLRTQLFLSYRRNDSIEQTNKLDEALTREFPGLGIFIDRRAIAGGENFELAMLGRLKESRVVLVLIGPGWLGPLPDGSLRIADPRDAVRLEVEQALAGLQRGQHLVPVLVAGAAMPAPAQLPASLQMLCKINALPLRSGDDQAGDLDRLLARVRAIVDDPQHPPRRPFVPRAFDGEDERLRHLAVPFAAAQQTLQALLATCATQASALRHQAEALLATAPHWAAEHPALDMIRYDRRLRRSDLDPVMDHALGGTGAVGNLTGVGNLRALRGAERQELDVALRLGVSFHATVQALRPVATVGWVYYISRRRFIHIHPWTHSRAFAYSDRLLKMDFFARGTARANPGREVFWTSPYEDHYGKGMMVTVAAPVYRGRRFLGTVSIDLGTDLLNDFVSAHRLARGSVFVVNARGDLIAAPGITRSHGTGPRPVADALPPELAARRDPALFDTPGTWLVGRHLVMVAAIAHTDWKLVHVCERASLR